MKTTKIEKFIIMAIIGLLISMFITMHSCYKQIEKEGGIRSVVINTGKEIKSISEDINK